MNTIVALIKDQFKMLRLIVIIGVIIAGLFVPLVLQEQLSLDVLLRDTVAEAQVPVYVGLISNIGIYLWIATATVCLFMAAVARQLQWEKQLIQFYIFLGLIFLLLGLDDAFLFHEEIFPRVFNISEIVVVAGYGLIILVFSIRFMPVIQKTPFLIMLIAIGLLLFSILVDKVHSTLVEYYKEAIGGLVEENQETDTSDIEDEETGNTESESNSKISWQSNIMDAIEDGPKLLAIVTCLVYAVLISLQHFQLYVLDRSGDLTNTGDRPG